MIIICLLGTRTFMKDFYSTTLVNTGQASYNKQGQNMDLMSYINQGQKGLQNQ